MIIYVNKNNHIDISKPNAKQIKTVIRNAQVKCGKSIYIAVNISINKHRINSPSINFFLSFIW